MARGREVFDETNMPRSEYKARVSKIQQQLKKKRVGALIVGGEAFDQGSYAYVTGYLAHVWWPGRTNYAVVPSNSDPIMIASAGPRDLPFLKTQTWIENIRSAKNLIVEAANVVKSLSPKPTKVGLAWLGPSKKADDYRMLQSQLSHVKFVEMNETIENLRKIKTENEVSQVRRACRALDLEHETLLRNLMVGVKEYEAEARADRMARLEGARDLRMLWSAGPEGHSILIPSRERAFANGDNISWFGTVEYAGYWAEIGRVFSLGEPSPALAKMYNAARTALERGISTLRPGVKVSKVHNEMQRALRASGYEADIQTDYGFGHEIGLDSAEKPFIDSSTNDVIQSGMVFSLRVPLYHVKDGSVLLGDTLVVIESGSESLTKASRDLAIIKE